MASAKQIPNSSVSGLSSLQRPAFTSGLLLEDDDLNSTVAYTRNLVRLMLKSLLGCGVICGFEVTVKDDGNARSIQTGAGIAVDCAGNLIEVTSPPPITLKKDGNAFPAAWLVVCYTETGCRPKSSSCECDEDVEPKPTRIRSGFDLRLYDNPPKCACWCAESGEIPPDDTTGGGGCCNETPAQPAQPRQAVPCECYLKHYEGKCSDDCACHCGCVVLARILADGTAVTSVVRRVRPVINGYLQCKQSQLNMQAVPGQGQ